METVRKIVVFFDICSSTTLLEDLLRTENQHRWRRLLISLKNFLVAEREGTLFEIYKFLGDGWILLFDDIITGADLMELLARLCRRYEELFSRHIRLVLEGDDYQVGLTFGVDAGTLVRITMTHRDEYIGRALNVAARLQDAIKQKDAAPRGKLLISKHAFAQLRLSASRKYGGTLVERDLRNISGGAHYQARKIVIHKGTS